MYYEIKDMISLRNDNPIHNKNITQEWLYNILMLHINSLTARTRILKDQNHSMIIIKIDNNPVSILIYYGG